ncbi:hypothetical protein HN018_28215 (plasmid) [Lichenicola cladoniae]|uniref:Uncharacterized protein n=1 Tax=Lichenicola cladoniae TaxID=1484109 RepID=A0A6M8I0F4_9PROT|nr:hypothetical protein [Lichenicola cladoniae]NPD70355.1 hypothetical protein [Acetobacteraceae bacterium]QKE94010.1 hypothetical protein HN018_28215 [Lichenicola cladoniae]
MPLDLAIEHASTSLLGMVILGLIAWGTWRLGYARMFTFPVGQIVMGLAVVDAVGLAFWS